MVLAVNQTLGRTSRIDTGRPGTGNAEIETGTFPASHGENNRPGFDFKQTVFPVHGCHNLIAADVHNHRI